MNRRSFRQLLRSIALGVVPLSVAAGAGCGNGASAPSGPCGPPQNFPGCGGGINYCVVPDAGTEALADGGVSTTACAQFCVYGTVCQLVEVDGTKLVQCSRGCLGRRPAGLVPTSRPADSDVGAYLAEAAHLEAASIAAFGILRRELCHYGAPRALVRLAERAAQDEVRHARSMKAIARRHGAICRTPRVRTRPVRSLLEVAIENVVEGCVRETYGAVVATYQSRAAGDGRMRAAMKTIAKDEAMHAALAWRVAAWADRRLTAADRRRVARAGQEAINELARAVSSSASTSVRQFAGLPGPTEAARMMAQMRSALWPC